MMRVLFRDARESACHADDFHQSDLSIRDCIGTWFVDLPYDVEVFCCGNVEHIFITQQDIGNLVSSFEQVLEINIDDHLVLILCV